MHMLIGNIYKKHICKILKFSGDFSYKHSQQGILKIFCDNVKSQKVFYSNQGDIVIAI